MSSTGPEEASPPTAGGGSSAVPVSPAFRARLLRFYEKHAPEKVGEVDRLAAHFAGREEATFRSLVAKYGPEPPSQDGDADGAAATTSSSASAAKTASTRAAPLPRAQTGGSPKKLPTKRPAGIPPPLSLKKMPLKLPAKAPAAPSPHSPTSAAAAAPQMASAVGSCEPSPYRDRLIRFYTHYEQHDRLSTVDSILETLKGREEAMFRKLVSKYGPEPAAPAIASVAKEAASLAAKEAGAAASTAGGDAAATVVSSTTSSSGAVPSPYRDRLVRFYTRYNPQKLPTVDSVLKQLAGREEEMFTRLTKHYGPEPPASDSDEQHRKSGAMGEGMSSAANPSSTVRVASATDGASAGPVGPQDARDHPSSLSSRDDSAASLASKRVSDASLPSRKVSFQQQSDDSVRPVVAETARQNAGASAIRSDASFGGSDQQRPEDSAVQASGECQEQQQVVDAEKKKEKHEDDVVVVPSGPAAADPRAYAKALSRLPSGITQQGHGSARMEPASTTTTTNRNAVSDRATGMVVSGGPIMAPAVAASPDPGQPVHSHIITDGSVAPSVDPIVARSAADGSGRMSLAASGGSNDGFTTRVATDHHGGASSSPTRQRPYAPSGTFGGGGSRDRFGGTAFGEGNDATPASPISSATANAAPPQPSAGSSLYFDRLRRFFQAYSPSRVGTEAALLEKYTGWEEALMHELTRKHGPEPDADGRLPPPAPGSPPRPSSSSLRATAVSPEVSGLVERRRTAYSGIDGRQIFGSPSKAVHMTSGRHEVAATVPSVEHHQPQQQQQLSSPRNDAPTCVDVHFLATASQPFFGLVNLYVASHMAPVQRGAAKDAAPFVLALCSHADEADETDDGSPTAGRATTASLLQVLRDVKLARTFETMTHDEGATDQQEDVHWTGQQQPFAGFNPQAGIHQLAPALFALVTGHLDHHAAERRAAQQALAALPAIYAASVGDVPHVQLTGVGAEPPLHQGRGATKDGEGGHPSPTAHIFIAAVPVPDRVAPPPAAKTPPRAPRASGSVPERTAGAVHGSIASSGTHTHDAVQPLSTNWAVRSASQPSLSQPRLSVATSSVADPPLPPPGGASEGVGDSLDVAGLRRDHPSLESARVGGTTSSDQLPDRHQEDRGRVVATQWASHVPSSSTTSLVRASVDSRRSSGRGELEAGGKNRVETGTAAVVGSPEAMRRHRARGGMFDPLSSAPSDDADADVGGRRGPSPSKTKRRESSSPSRQARGTSAPRPTGAAAAARGRPSGPRPATTRSGSNTLRNETPPPSTTRATAPPKAAEKKPVPAVATSARRKASPAASSTLYRPTAAYLSKVEAARTLREDVLRGDIADIARSDEVAVEHRASQKRSLRGSSPTAADKTTDRAANGPSMRARPGSARRTGSVSDRTTGGDAQRVSSTTGRRSGSSAFGASPSPRNPATRSSTGAPSHELMNSRMQQQQQQQQQPTTIAGGDPRRRLWGQGAVQAWTSVAHDGESSAPVAAARGGGSSTPPTTTSTWTADYL